MKILITGGAGFLGSNLSKRLLNDGNHVIVVDNLLTGNRENIKSLIGQENFEFHQCGIEEKTFLDLCQNLGNDFDRIYNLACPTGVPNIEILGEEMLMACSVGTMNVMEVARKSNAKLLFTSSSEVYGEPKITPQSEEYTGNVETTGFRSNYEEGKRFSETIVAHYVKKYGVHAVMVRLFNVYGPNMHLDDQRVIARFVTQALAGQPLTVQGGSQSRTLCYVDDILNGFEAVITKGVPAEIYNLGSDKDLTMKEFAEKVIEFTNSESGIQIVERPAHDHSSRMPVLDKVRALGWNNDIELNTRLKLTIEDFKIRLAERVSEPEYAVAENLQLQPQM